MRVFLTNNRRASSCIRHLTLVAVVTCGGVAAAEPSSLPALPLDFSAPAACIDVSTFRAHLAALPPSPHGTELPRAIRVRVVDREGSFTGELVITHADETTTRREVTSGRCDEVTEALEFVAALALGLEHARANAAPSSTPAPSAPPKTEPSYATESTIAAPAPHARVRVLGAVAAGLVSNVAPRAGFAPSVAIGLMLDGPSFFAPEVELSGTRAASGTIETSLGSAKMTLLDAALTACPVRVRLGSAFALRPCAELQIGALSADASASSLSGAKTQVRPWSAAAALARAEWSISASFVVRAEGGAVFPLLYDRFYFTPSTDVYSVEPLGAVARVGAAIVLP